MGKKKKHKKKRNKQYQNVVPNLDKERKSDIEKLQEKRNAIDEKAKTMKEGKGFFGKLGVNLRAGMAKVNYNRAINERKSFIKAGRQIQHARRLTELEKAKGELNREREKNKKQTNFNKINMDDIFTI